jgi:hypothetical protein
MFVKPLALLFSNVFAYFSAFLNCRSFQQIAVKGGSEERSPCLCPRAHSLTIECACDLACGPGSSASMYSRDPHVALGHRTPRDRAH